MQQLRLFGILRMTIGGRAMESALGPAASTNRQCEASGVRRFVCTWSWTGSEKLELIDSPLEIRCLGRSLVENLAMAPGSEW